MFCINIAQCTCYSIFQYIGLKYLFDINTGMYKIQFTPVYWSALTVVKNYNALNSRVCILNKPWIFSLATMVMIMLLYDSAYLYL